MSILKTLQSLSSAEEFFVVLDVPFDPKVVHVARLHILRRMGESLRKEDFSTVTDDAQVALRCRELLARAYQDFVESSPIEQRVFKVLQDAVKPKSAPKQAFISLGSLPKKGERAMLAT